MDFHGKLTKYEQIELNNTINVVFAHQTGSPFKFHVDSITSGHITAYGPGLMHGVSGEPSDFTIYTKGAGAGAYIL